MGKQQINRFVAVQTNNRLDILNILVKAYKTRNISGDQINPARREVFERSQSVGIGQAGRRGRLRQQAPCCEDFNVPWRRPPASPKVKKKNERQKGKGRGEMEN